jgi:hypothetical protein
MKVECVNLSAIGALSMTEINVQTPKLLFSTHAAKVDMAKLR